MFTSLQYLIGTARRYIALNPLRAKLVKRPEDYKWSSAKAHLQGEDDILVKVDPLSAISFLGFDFRRIKTHRCAWGVRVTPRMKSRTTLLRKLKDVFRRDQSQPVDRVVYLINRILRGWVNYFRVGNSSRCFCYVKDWVEKKIRRHLMSARKRRGFGWKRWSRGWLYETLGLYNDYGVRYCQV